LAMHSVFELDSPSKNVPSVSAIYANDPSLFGRPSASFFAQVSKPLPALESKTTNMAKEAARVRRWAKILREDTEKYNDEPLFKAHGIVRLVDNENHSWTCENCGALFTSLHDCLDHCATPAHTKNLWWPYTQYNLPLPAQPQWSTTRPSSASAGTSGYCIRLVDAMVNGRFHIPNAVLVVFDPTAEAPSQEAAFVMTDAQICGDFQAANGLPADDLPPFVRPSPVPTGGEVDGDSLPSRRPMPWSGSAPATSAAPVRVQSGQLINDGHLSDTIPTTSHRRRPGPPTCADVGAVDERAAAAWTEGRRRGQRLRPRWAAATSSSDDSGGVHSRQSRW